MSTNNIMGKVEMLALPEPIIHMDKLVYEKIMHWVRKGASHECSGMGKVQILDGGIIKIIDAFMVKQKNSGAETEMDADHFAKMMYEKREVPGSWSFWWHSHANMDTFWSGTDRDQIAKIANNGLCVATVFNNSGKSLTCVASSKPFPFHIDSVKLSVIDLSIVDKLEDWTKEYDSCVEKVIAPTIWTQNSVNDEYWNSWNNNKSDFNSSGRSVSSIKKDAKTLEEKNKENEEKERGARAEIDRTKSDSLSIEEMTYSDIIERIKWLYDDMDTLEDCVQTQFVTKDFCELIEIKYDPTIRFSSLVEGDNGLTIEDYAWNKIQEIDNEIEKLLTEAKVRREHGANTSTHQ